MYYLGEKRGNFAASAYEGNQVLYDQGGPIKTEIKQMAMGCSLFQEKVLEILFYENF